MEAILASTRTVVSATGDPTQIFDDLIAQKGLTRVVGRGRHGDLTTGRNSLNLLQSQDNPDFIWRDCPFGDRAVRRNLFWLSNEQWEWIEPHLPTDVRGVERADDRRVISGIEHG